VILDAGTASTHGLATRIITFYYGIDGLLRTRDVFGWSLERSNKWLLANASAAVLR
jgi:hypothetical protein